MDESLKAAIGYMIPDGQDVADILIALQEMVAAEASNASQSVIVQWHGMVPLKAEFGELTASVTKVGEWAEWSIARKHGNKVWPVLHWEEIRYHED